MHTVKLEAGGQYLWWLDDENFSASGAIAGWGDSVGGSEPEMEHWLGAGKTKHANEPWDCSEVFM